MRALLVAMKKGHPGQDEGLKTCWQTLLKMCGNVYNNPGELGGGGGAALLQAGYRRGVDG